MDSGEFAKSVVQLESCDTGQDGALHNTSDDEKSRRLGELCRTWNLLSDETQARILDLAWQDVRLVASGKGG